MFYDIEQNTDDWLDLRAGKVTGSGISKIMANYGKAFGEPAKKYAVDVALGQITGRAQGDNYTNTHMDRGHEQEPLARQLYEDDRFCEVLNGGFFDNGFTGCSPDGRIDNGLIEIKSVIPSVQYATLKRGSFDPAYKWQINFNLKESNCEWIDYVSFCLDFPENKRIIVYRTYAETQQEEFKMIDLRLSEFKDLVYQIKRDICDDCYQESDNAGD